MYTDAQYIGRDSSRYPPRLRAVRPMINGLWYRGELTLTGKEYKTAAIVGSRKMSRYGRQVLTEIVPALTQAGYVTVSGFMYGIDVEVARLTYQSGGKHIAVLGWGIDRENDVEDINLYHKLVEEYGLLLSELEGKMHPMRFTFPRRNRITVGLADIVIVAEAGAKSGSLNSAEWARKAGKPVYAVPGSIFSSTSWGTNTLIEQKMAKALTPQELDRITNTQGIYSEIERKDQTKPLLVPIERTIVTLLRLEGPQSVNVISRHLSMSIANVTAILSSLQLRNAVSMERGVWKAGL